MFIEIINHITALKNLRQGNIFPTITSVGALPGASVAPRGVAPLFPVAYSLA